MIYLNIHLRVKEPADVEKVGELLRQQGQLSRAEPGCLRFDVYKSKNEANYFLLVEHWTDEAALDLHRLAKAYMTIYKPQVLPLIDRVPHPCDLLE